VYTYNNNNIQKSKEKNMQITLQTLSTTLNYAKTELSSYLVNLSIPSLELDKIDISIKTDKNITKVKDYLLDDAFRIDIVNGKGEIIGNNERSSLLAVYHFLYSTPLYSLGMFFSKYTFIK